MAKPAAPEVAGTAAAQETGRADPVPRRRRVDAQRNRRAILKAAEIVFRTQGADAPIDEIARRAGVGVGTVYRNYPTKAAVIQAIIEARIAPIIIAARKARAAEDSGEAFFALLRRLVEESSVFKPLMDSIVAAGVDVHAAKTELLNELVTAMGELLAGAQRSGWVRHDVSIDDVTMLMAGLSHTSLAASDKPARSRCVNLVCDALRGDKSTARAAGRAHPRSL